MISTFLPTLAMLPVPIRDEEVAIAIIVPAMVAISILVGMGIKARTRLTEKKLEVLHELARHGHYDPDKFDDLKLSPKLPAKSTWMKLFFVGSWLGLLLGTAFLVGALIEGWPDHYNPAGFMGIMMMVVSLGVMSVPVMLREMKRQGLV